MSEFPVGVYRSYKAIETRKLRFGLRPMDSAAIAAVAFGLYVVFSFKGLMIWWLPVVAIISVTAVVALKRLYGHSLYWREYLFGKNAYGNDKWTVR